jgi:hypothetical protein
VKAEYVLLACLAVTIVAVAASTIASFAFCIRLKRFEHGVWLSLGSPMPEFGYMADLTWFVTTRRFLREETHRSLRDQKSIKLGELVVFTDRFLLGVAFVVAATVGYIIAFVKP